MLIFQCCVIRLLFVVDHIPHRTTCDNCAKNCSGYHNDYCASMQQEQQVSTSDSVQKCNIVGHEIQISTSKLYPETNRDVFFKFCSVFCRSEIV